MKETLVVHPDYAKKKAALQDVIHRFDSVGEFVVKGERNVIKKVAVAGEILNVKKLERPTSFKDWCINCYGRVRRGVPLSTPKN